MTIKIQPVVNGNAVCQATLIGKPLFWFGAFGPLNVKIKGLYLVPRGACAWIYDDMQVVHVG